MKKRDVVEAIILNKNGEVLLQKKDLNYKTIPGGYWMLFGGEIEEGEAPETTIKREIKEELGYEITESNLFAIKDYNVEGKFEGKRYIFLIKFNGKISDLRLEEGAGFAFFDKSELDSTNIEKEFELKTLKEYFSGQ